MKSLELSRYLIIVIGSYKVSMNPHNPWPAPLRKKWICDELSSQDLKRVKFIFLRDRIYNEPLWRNDLVNQVSRLTGSSSKSIALIGHKKDESSYYLEIFPHWTFLETGLHGSMHSALLRADYFLKENLGQLKNNIPKKVNAYLLKFKSGSKFKAIKKEFQNLKKAGLDKTDYDLVLCQNHILLELTKNKIARFSLPSIKRLFQETKQRPFIDTSIFNEVKKIKSKKYDYSLLNKKYRNKVTFYSLELSVLPKLSNSFLWIGFEDLISYEDSFEKNHYQIISNLLFHDI
jgi:nicotinamide mononucleotide adenylyltransferase